MEQEKIAVLCVLKNKYYGIHFHPTGFRKQNNHVCRVVYMVLPNPRGSQMTKGRVCRERGGYQSNLYWYS